MMFKAMLRLHDGKLPVEYQFEVGQSAEISLRSKARGCDLEITTPAEDMTAHQVQVRVTDPKGEVIQDETETITPVAAGAFTYRKRVRNLSVEGVYTLYVLITEGGKAGVPEGVLMVDKTQRPGLPGVVPVSEPVAPVQPQPAVNEPAVERVEEPPEHERE